MSETIFWGVLSIAFFLLAILPWHYNNKLLRRLYIVADKGGMQHDHKNHEDFPTFSPIHSAFRLMSAVNFIAFILASVAAVLSSGLI